MDAANAPEPELVDVDGATTAVVRGIVPLTELAGFFDHAFQALGAAMAEQGVEILGPAFALYRGQPTDHADLEAGFVTSATVEPIGDVDVGALPGGRVARVVHEGSFDDLGASWANLASWIAAEGLTPGPTLWEVYVTEPSPDMDPADLRTELNWIVG